MVKKKRFKTIFKKKWYIFITLAIISIFFLFPKLNIQNKNTPINGYVLSPYKNGKPDLQNGWVITTDGNKKEPYKAETVVDPYPKDNYVGFDEAKSLERKFRDSIGKNAGGYSDYFFGILANNTPGKEYLFYSYPQADQKNFGEIPNRNLELWRFNPETKEVKKILSSKRYDACSHVVKWEPLNHEIITSIELPVSSEEYTKGFCIIDDMTGKTIKKYIIPGYQSQEFNYIFPYTDNNKLLIKHFGSGKSEVYLFNFDTTEFKNVTPEGWSQIYMEKAMDKGNVLFQNSEKEIFTIFNINSQTFKKPFTIPVDDPKHTYIGDSHIFLSPDYKYGVFEEFKSNRHRCYWVYNLENSEYVSKTCDEDLQTGKEKYVEYSFAGWLK